MEDIKTLGRIIGYGTGYLFFAILGSIVPICLIIITLKVLGIF